MDIQTFFMLLGGFALTNGGMYLLYGRVAKLEQRMDDWQNGFKLTKRR